MRKFDLIIVGGGPAGLSAAIYGQRGGLNCAVIEKAAPGGQVTSTWEVENYPGSPKDATGPMIAERMHEQALSFGCEFISDTIESVGVVSHYTLQGMLDTYHAPTVIFAMGASPRLLGAPGENELRGLGVSYCATCDANFFKGLDVAVVGGGDTALEETLYLTKFAKHIDLIHRRDTFRAAKILQDRVLSSDQITVHYDSKTKEIKAGPDGLVNEVTIENIKTGEETNLSVQGIFIFVGHIPDTKFLEGIVDLTKDGYIKTDHRMQTNLKGVYAAGDVREKELRQIVTATSDGAIAAVNCVKYLEDHE